MPVYLLTAHAYRSWSEDNPRGYLQHGQGLQPPNPQLAAWRRQHANDSPIRFDASMQPTLHDVAAAVAREEGFDAIDLHASCVTPTHFHILLAFARPACECGHHRSCPAPAAPQKNVCNKRCPARGFAERWFNRTKTIAGYRLAKLTQRPGRKWFSRGGDLSRVNDQKHHEYLLNHYLPKHEQEGGTVRRYR